MIKEDFITPPLAYPIEDKVYEVTLETLENIVESDTESLTLEELYKKAITLNTKYRMFSFIFNGERFHFGIIPNYDKTSEFEFKYLIAKNKYNTKYSILYVLSPENILEAIDMILIREIHGN